MVVGRGDRARLWSDIMVEGASLKEAFPRIYSLASNKFGYVRDYDNWVGKRWTWDISLRRSCLNWELEQWDLFKKCLESIKIWEPIPNTIGWSLCSDGQFSVESF